MSRQLKRSAEKDADAVHGAKRPCIVLLDQVQVCAPTRAIVNLAAIRRNVGIFRRICEDLGSCLMAVVKADAYGHGAVRVAREMAASGVRAFATATVAEAVELRDGGLLDARVLVLGAPLPGDLPLFLHHGLEAMISSLDVARALAASKAATRGSRADVEVSVHLYLETGMTRLGLQPQEVPRALEMLNGVEGIKIVGICSHFAESDNPSSDYVEEQMDNFDLGLKALRQHPLGKDLHLDIHFGNSGALLDARFHDMCGQRYYGGLSRPGCALYGCYPQQSARRSEQILGQFVDAPRQDWVKKEILLHRTADEQLAEAMTLVTKVMNVMDVAAGQSVGYSRTWRAQERCLIATLGIGYADGYPRAASNQAQVSIRGRYYPVVGNVCMDMTMVNLGDPDGLGRHIEVGDEAVLFGPGGLSASETAFHCGTIQHELLSGLTRRVQRLYVDDEDAAKKAGASPPSFRASLGCTV